MEQLTAQLDHELARLDAHSMCRRLRQWPSTGRLIHTGRGHTLVNLASNDYLALTEHPRLKDAAIGAIRRYGTGSGSSRLVIGHLAIHQEVEQQFAAFKHAQAALLFPTGYMANLAVLGALAGPGDLICIDKLSHASLIDAARASVGGGLSGGLPGGGGLRSFPHLQTDKLERLLKHHHRLANAAELTSTSRPPRRFIVTDSVFSMDGDCADLPALCVLAEQYEAIMVVDEAHATGVLGRGGTGLCEVAGVSARVDVVISTASKALGGLGGIVTASRQIIQTLINRARPLIYTTALPPAQVAVIGAALQVVADEPWRRQRLVELSTRVRDELERAGWALPVGRPPTPIIPLVVGSAASALALAKHLEDHGLLGVAIRPPTVPPDSGRVRLSLRADIEDGDIDRLLSALAKYKQSSCAR